MARPPKIGLDYYSVDTDRYQNKKIKRLKHSCGATGVAVYDYIQAEIYRVKGAYIVWDDDLCFDLSEYWDIAESDVLLIVKKCVEVGLYNDEQFNVNKVLTSKEIQIRYASICKEAKRKDWFIPSEMDLTTEETLFNSVDNQINSGDSTQRKEKESKIKESKENELTFPPFAKEEFMKVWGNLILEKKWKGKSQNALQLSLDKLAAAGNEADAIEMMKNAIAGNWQGVFPLEKNKKYAHKSSIEAGNSGERVFSGF